VKPHIFHPEADAEYAAAALYYAGIDPELGRRFFDEIESLILEVRKAPERFWMFDPPARRHLSTVFPYSVVYLDKPDYIWIVAVMHGHQCPGYWRERFG
jgi:phage terminase large subunit-like protein